jgi:long-subunit fatty acid transport protein
MKIRSLSFAAMALCVASSARATPLLETLGPVGSIGGFNPVVSDPSAASAYFNPAMLEDADDRLDLGFALLSEQISLTLGGRPLSADIPVSIGARDVVTGPPGKALQLPNTVVPTAWLPDRQHAGTAPDSVTRPYLILGGLKHLIKNRFTVGAYLMLPLANLTTANAFFNDEREAIFSNSLHPELYGDRLTAMSIVIGGSFRLLKQLSLGIGTTLGLANTATSESYVPDATDYKQLLVNNTIGVTAALAPHAGVYWTPASRVRVGAVIHAPSAFVIDTTISATLPNNTVAKGTQHEVHDSIPWRVSLGAEFDLVRTAHYQLSVAAEVRWMNWSTYEDRHGETPAHVNANANGDNHAFDFSDTFVYSLGVRHKYKKVRGYIDWQYAPTPVRDQVGRSNYVDSDRWGLAFGGDFEAVVGGVRLRPGLQLTAYRLAWRNTTKDPKQIPDELPDDARSSSTGDPVAGAKGLQTNNPGFPGFGSDGWIYGGSVSLAVIF